MILEPAKGKRCKAQGKHSMDFIRLGWSNLCPKPYAFCPMPHDSTGLGHVLSYSLLVGLRRKLTDLRLPQASGCIHIDLHGLRVHHHAVLLPGATYAHVAIEHILFH